jgi:hypothetical protein
MEHRRYNGPPKHAFALPLDLDRDWDDLIWSGAEDERLAFRQWFNRVRKRCSRIGRQINADQKRAKREEIAELKRQQQADLEAVVAAQETRIQAAIAADYIESRRVCDAYVEKLRAAMQAKLKAEHDEEEAWRASVRKRLAKIDRDIERSAHRAERMEMIRRGVLRGRR